MESGGSDSDIRCCEQPTSEVSFGTGAPSRRVKEHGEIQLPRALNEQKL